jgi:GDP-L-fucose synthase
MHVDDMADACLHLLEHYDGAEQVNVGTGRDSTIREIAELVAEVVGYEGNVHWDASKPDGTPQKLLDVSKLAGAGWTAKIGMREGLESTVAWYREHVGDLLK